MTGREKGLRVQEGDYGERVPRARNRSSLGIQIALSRRTVTVRSSVSICSPFSAVNIKRV